MSVIEVSTAGRAGSGSRFRVSVVEGDGSTEHEVTLSDADRDRLAHAYPSPEAFIRACFGFLLEREPKESILRSFDVGQISTYFPEFDRVIARPTE